MLSIYEVRNDSCLSALAPPELSPTWPKDNIVRWIRLMGPAQDELEAILGAIGVSEEMLQDGHGQEIRTHVVVRGSRLLVSLPVMTGSGQRVSCLQWIYTQTSLISIEPEALPALDSLATELQDNEDSVQLTLPNLFLENLDAVFMEVRPAYYSLRRDVDAVAAALEVEPSETSMDSILELQHRVTELSVMLEDQLYCLAELQRCRLNMIRAGDFREQLLDHVAKVERGSKLVDRVEDRLRDLRQRYLDGLQEVTSRRLNVLAVLSAIYLPPTLIAGIYGMNFEGIPITEIRYGYFIVISVMAAVVLGQCWYFYRRGWFK